MEGLVLKMFNFLAAFIVSCSSTLAIPGADFAIAAGDTRMSVGYSISTRYSSKLCKLFVGIFIFGVAKFLQYSKD